jgi:threonine 3-dehydrogenase
MCVAVLAGSVAPDSAVALDPECVVRRQLSIFGVHNYEPRHLSVALRFCGTTAIGSRGRISWPRRARSMT